MSIMDGFDTLEDPRVDRCKRHHLLDIIAIAIAICAVICGADSYIHRGLVTVSICAVICGADPWVYIELFGKSKEESFRTFLELPHGIPSHDNFGDVFSWLDPEQFQRCFIAGTRGLDPGGVRPGPRENGGQRREDATLVPRTCHRFLNRSAI